MRKAELAAAETEVQNLSRSLIQHVEDTIDLAGLALAGIAHRLETDGMNDETVQRVRTFLHLRKADLPWVRGLFVYGADGTWLATTESVRLSDYNNSDRDYFQYHRSNPSRRAYIGRPVRSRSSGIWIITVSRRINDKDGSFAGVVLATIDIRYFAQNFARFDVGPQGSITLLHEDAGIMARHPLQPDRLGTPVRAPPLAATMKNSAAGIVYFTSTIDGVERVSAFHHGQRHPLAMLVARGTSDVLEPWQSAAKNRLVIVASLAMVIFFLGLLILRQLTRRQRMMQALARQESEFRLLAESSSDLVVRVNADLSITYSSPAAARILGKAPGELVGRSLLTGVSPDDVTEAERMMTAVLKGEQEDCLLSYRFYHPCQGIVWLETALSASRDRETGEVDGLVGMTRNVTQQKLLEHHLSRQATTDGLTGIANRRLFDERIRREFALAKESGEPLSLMIIDVDHFKGYNDAYGHQKGDECLRNIANCLECQVTRPSDLVARYGGEEFAMILPDTDTEGAFAVCERIHEALTAIAIPHRASSTRPSVTVSIGLATQSVRTSYSHHSDLIGQADAQLYVAKSAGRNRTVAQPTSVRRQRADLRIVEPS